MAEGSSKNILPESEKSEQPLRPDEVPRKKRNFSAKTGDRSRKPQSKALRRRACTPEPGVRAWTDESERDQSDGENLVQHSEAKDRGQSSSAPRTRVSHRPSELVASARRTRSADRAPAQDAEGDGEDFETIRSMHKTKELEEDAKEKLPSEAKANVEEAKTTVRRREMPPLIATSTESRKRARHRNVPPQGCRSDCATAKPSPVAANYPRRKLSTSEEEDNEGKTDPENRGKYAAKAGKSKVNSSEPEEVQRKWRRGSRKDRSEASESEGRSSERTQDEEDESDEASDAGANGSAPTGPPSGRHEERATFFTRWFSLGNKSGAAERGSGKEQEDGRGSGDAEACERREGATEEGRSFLKDAVRVWRAHVEGHSLERRKISALKNKCLSQLLLVLMFCGFGGLVFRFVEGSFESFYKCGVKRVKRDFIDNLWSYSQYMTEEDWKSQARRKLMELEEQVHTAHEAGMTTYSGQKAWSFLNSVVYCLTVITTIGYGHISPSTTTGRAITIVYAIFGIPLFLILLADFGKLFTRGIKFLWAFVRRLYYTGSCKKVRKTAPVQEMMKGVQLVYGFAKSRRPSHWGMDQQPQHQQQSQLQVMEGDRGNLPETPGTPNLSAFEIDDEFNLPISVAITILLIYIFFGATIYWSWEEWSFFESFYFVFISMSTIGFGDFVPQNPIYMMASIVYLVFGLALTSMCINVVQEKLTDTFRQASTKIGATIGLRVAEDGTLSAPAELADVNPIQNLN